jgi:hypothetical protein
MKMNNVIDEESVIKLEKNKEEIEKIEQEKKKKEEEIKKELKLKNTIENLILIKKMQNLKIQQEMLYEDAGINIDGLSKLSELNVRKGSVQASRKVSTVREISVKEISNEFDTNVETETEITENYIIKDNLSPTHREDRKSSKAELLKKSKEAKEFFRLKKLDNKFSNNERNNYLTINEVLNM